MKPSLEKARLLLVTDPREDLAERVRAGIKGGVNVVQLRDKSSSARELLSQAEELREVCESEGAVFTVNDDVQLARKSGAGGLHLGQDDGPLAGARRRLGAAVLIGRSVGTVEEARVAVDEGADYLGVGAMYATPTKPEGEVAGLELVRSLVRADLGLPFYAIGGVTLETAPEVAAAGAWGFAVVRAVLDADDPEVAAKKLRALLP
ncbi:thiamine phosphate synthase [Rubrobacter indicoceani]|uniref:thiamine phosphate synthase n=1 Tax=Rubrobacter indicoceani TaxID=2051957 RepID=UPI000E5B3A94|nr:thiamine phosphate synthase [Rubrobacter indicoceani]